MTASRKEDVDTKEGYTVKDIYALPEGERAELINGQIYYMAPPKPPANCLITKPEDSGLY